MLHFDLLLKSDLVMKRKNSILLLFWSNNFSERRLSHKVCRIYAQALEIMLLELVHKFEHHIDLGN